MKRLSKFSSFSTTDKASIVLNNLGIIKECKQYLSNIENLQIKKGFYDIINRYEGMCSDKKPSSRKEELRKLLDKQKIETITENFNSIKKYLFCYIREEAKTCDLLNGKITIYICKQNEIEKWKMFEHLTTSLPYRDAMGRQIKLFVKCDNRIIGMVHITSPLLQNKLRDQYLGWNTEKKYDEGLLNTVYNIQTCVSLRTYSDLLTGKLLVYCCYSKEVADILQNTYKDVPLGMEVTSLFGKSSLYNRIPFLKHLGLSDGYSAVYISTDEWKAILKEFNTVFPDSKGTVLKFQILDKLAAYYKKNNKIFPYVYKDDAYKRGIYFGFFDNTSLQERVEQWRERWFKMRLEKERTVSETKQK